MAVFLSYFLITMKTYQFENSILGVSEILRLFVNILTLDDKYSLSVKSECLTKPIQIQLSQNQKRFFQYFSALSESA